MTRIWAGLLGAASLLIVATGATAEQGKGQKGPDLQKQQQQKGGGAGKAKHQHKNANGHQLIGAKLKQDGKHGLGKLKGRDLVAEVKGGKITAMSAGDLPMKRVRSKTKVAAFDDGIIRAAWAPGLQLAQYEEYWYGYCFDDGYDYDCYWYPASDVDYEDYAWDDYDPYY